MKFNGERIAVTDSRDAKNWAEPIDFVNVGEVAGGAATGNVQGRRPVGPLQGFGRLWQKTYEVNIPGTTPEDVIATWKQRFGEFWYPGTTFYGPQGGMSPGQVTLIDGGKGPARLTTGVRIIYADARSWSYVNPEGHPWAGIITFSAHEGDEGQTIARVHLLVRAIDPLFELGFSLYTSRLEDKIWNHTLTQVARHFGVEQPLVAATVTLVDRKRQWRHFNNFWTNSAIRTLLHRDRHPAPGPESH